MIIQHNILAMNNVLMGKQLQKSKSKNMERLSSGYRINRAADDAANMAISEKMRSSIRALARCQNNIEEGISLTQTADGALHEVNNMLNRVNELCVQAANDTNTSEDRSKIAEEITQIYDDMDRIFEDTEFNTLKIFRHDGDNYYGPDPEYEYHESITELPPGDLHSWGTGIFPTRQFDLAKPATAATATLTLADGVDLADATTLDGTSFFIKYGNSSYKIEFGQDKSTSYIGNTLYINTKGRTVQSAFNAICTNYSYALPHSKHIDKFSFDNNQVTITFLTPEETKQITYSADTNGDGVRENITAYEVVENGAAENGISIYCSGNTLNPVDSLPSTLTASSTMAVDLPIMKNVADDYILTSDEISNLKQNYLYLSNNGNRIDFINDVNMDQISTAGQLREAIANAIDKTPNYTANYDSQKNTIHITLQSATSSAYIYEINPSTTVHSETTTALTIPVTQTQVATSEKQAKYTIQIPAITDSNPYSFKIEGNTYTIYNKSKYDGYDYTNISTSPYTPCYSTTNPVSQITSIIKNNYNADYEIVDLGNGTLELTAKQLNDNSGLNIQSYSTNLQLYKSAPTTLGTGVAYFSRDYSVSLNLGESLGSSFDTTALYGRGFLLNNTYYQFTSSTDSTPLFNASTQKILLDGVTNEADLCQAIAQATGTSCVTDSANPGTVILQFNRSTSYASSTNFSDGGPSGTFTNSAVSSGGTEYKNPQVEIDFSQYDMSNLNELYGTGFRLTCATCPGEFVNIIFCHDKSELDYPESFEYTDDNGNTNLIHNYMVELKDVTHGSQIAANIAEQLKDDLDHFTEVKVSDTNPSVLIAQDKRSLDQNGRGQVMAGVYTNFIYHLDAEKIPNPDDKVGGGRKDTDAYYAYCMIYAGDTQEKPYIAVHLPHFSVENLKLEYPKEPWDSYEEITDVMNRSKNAAEVISMARSKIGADQNRLEHAFDYASNAEVQIAEANSRIKDTDMAEAVTLQAKLTILSNTQEAMLSQITDFPKRILSLLQQK